MDIDAGSLAAALGVAPHVAPARGTVRTYSVRQPVAFAPTLQQCSTLDLVGRRFRSTLWAAAHRCLEHVELADVLEARCDVAAGRLVVASATWQLVLGRQGTLSVQPVDTAASPAARRRRQGRPS